MRYLSKHYKKNGLNSSTATHRRGSYTILFNKRKEKSDNTPCFAVVAQFYPLFKFYFPLFWGMVMYVNEF